MKYIISALTIIFVANALSCKRSDDTSLDYGQGVGACRLIAVYQASPNHPELIYSYHFTYDASNRIVKQINQAPSHAPLVYTYTYSSNHITIDYLDSGQTVSSSIIITLDDKGRAITMRSAQQIGSYYAYHYNANGDLQTSEIVSDTGKAIVEHYMTWQNGDLVKDSSNYRGYVLYYTYDLTKPAQVANYWWQVPGYNGVFQTSRHRVESQLTVDLININANYSTKHIYEYDAQGKILVDSFGNRSPTKMEYECR